MLTGDIILVSIGTSVVVISAVIYWGYNPRKVVSGWQHSFDGAQYSSQDLYASVERNITKREINGVKFSRFKHMGKGMLDPFREYLRVERGPLTYDICAAPFGTGYYVSCRLRERGNIVRELLGKVKLFEPLLEIGRYYAMDTEAVFQQFVHRSLTEAIDEMLQSKGVRALTDSEKQLQDYRKK